MAYSFDIRRWGFVVSRIRGLLVGGTAVIAGGAAVDTVERRNDLAILWDIRVAPAVRRQGVGTALLAASEQWARARGMRILKVETQNINVPACRFYAARGFTIGEVNRYAFPEFAREIQLVWYKNLDSDAPTNLSGLDT